MLRYLVLIFTLFLTAPLHAADPQPFKATYGLFAGGVSMVDVNTSFDLKPKHYSVTTDARTTGIFSKILPWSGTFETEGTDDYKPIRHDYTVRWRNDYQKSTFSYEPAGVFKEMSREGESIEEPDPTIAEGTRDLLSASVLMFSKFDKTGKCASDVAVFDGTRSFIVRFADAGTAEMQNEKLSSYTGPASACTIEIIPQKGKWPKKPRGWLRIQQQAEGRLPVLWMAKPRADLPAIPVRVDIHTKYGDVIAHLTGLN
jgi:hypothetical protein